MRSPWTLSIFSCYRRRRRRRGEKEERKCWRTRNWRKNWRTTNWRRTWRNLTLDRVLLFLLVFVAVVFVLPPFLKVPLLASIVVESRPPPVGLGVCGLVLPALPIQCCYEALLFHGVWCLSVRWRWAVEDQDLLRHRLKDQLD